MQLRGGGLRRAGHAAQTRIAAKEVLQRHRAQDAPVGLPLEAFLGFERRLQAVGPVAIGHDPARELVDDPDAAVAHDVVDVAPQEHLRMQRAVELGQQAVVLRVVEAAAAERALDLLEPASVSSTSRPVSRRRRSGRRASSEATSAASRGATTISRPTLPAMTSGTRASSMRSESASSTSAKWNGAVHEIAAIHGQQIAQMIESRLLGRDVGDVGAIGAPALVGRHALLDESDREPEQRVDGPHPLGVAARQVVVERQDVRRRDR